MPNLKRDRVLWHSKRVVALFVALFVVALVVRIPAISFPAIYALHGILVAPFFAAIAVFHLKRGNPAWEFGGSILLLALVLSVMSPVMGVSFVVVAAVFLLADFLVQKASFTARMLTVSVVVSLASYLSPAMTGLTFGYYVMSAGAALQVIMLAVASILVGLLTSIVVMLVEKPLK